MSAHSLKSDKPIYWKLPKIKFILWLNLKICLCLSSLLLKAKRISSVSTLRWGNYFLLTPNAASIKITIRRGKTMDCMYWHSCIRLGRRSMAAMKEKTMAFRGRPGMRRHKSLMEEICQNGLKWRNIKRNRSLEDSNVKPVVPGGAEECLVLAEKGALLDLPSNLPSMFCTCLLKWKFRGQFERYECCLFFFF